ncbi:MAG: hypothetical protein ACFWTP_17520 [Enterococcus gilvus]|jgi:predicted ABC-type transport system involved in lysophospholipase L1 biosynthesis ATPase subunit
MDKRRVNQERLNELLELLGLSQRKNHLPNQLSGGQQQRVSVGRDWSTRQRFYWRMSRQEAWIVKTGMKFLLS